MRFLERLFEGFLWRSRLMVLFAVVFSLVAAFGMFIVASVEIYEPIRHMFESSFHLTAE
ncbi:MAG: YqhA family protein, partial [Desulfurobacterium sp.]